MLCQLELLTLAFRRSPCRLADLGLFVQCVAATTRAELLDLELLSLLFLVPGGHIIAPLAAVAR